MIGNAMTEPEFDEVKQLLLDMGQQHTCAAVLTLTVQRLAADPTAALARIWLVRPGDMCGECPMRAQCPDQAACLHLVASAGTPQADREANWSRIDGEFRRFPLGIHKVGRIGATGEAIGIPDLAAESQWLAHPEWAAREGVRAFCGQPLIYKGEVLGVLAVFRRAAIPTERFAWHRLIADHAAAAIANARAFEEIERLREQLERENAYLREEVSEAQEFGAIVGHSAAIRTIAQQIELVAPTEATALILGESGTGKELVAREIHDRSARTARPLVRVNCASIPRELYESEFFGHVKGAFTGAVRDRVGRFELADGGTLFLDEVGEIPRELQSKLLRVLQEGEYERVGDDLTRHVNVRVIAATNRELKADVDAGRFRQDLYYRLNVFPLEIPPLRERPEDIPLLADHFLAYAAKRMKRPQPRLTQGNVLQLQQYTWPGNVRELQNVLERAVITSRGHALTIDLPAAGPLPSTTPPPTAPAQRAEVLTDDQMQRRERDNLRAALEHTGWKVYGAGGAAELLQMKPTTLASRMKRFGLARSERGAA